MEKLIIVAGSPNTGKTLSTQKLITKLLENKASCLKYFDYEKKEWKIFKDNDNLIHGAVIIEYNKKRICIITYGDLEEQLTSLFDSHEIEKCDIVVCCSHATRGKKVFGFFHDWIKENIDLKKTKLIPLFKNFLCNYGDINLENEYTADLLFSLL